MPARWFSITTALLGLSASTAVGQHGGTGAPATMATASARDGAIRIDGRMEEPAWEAADPITAFVQGEPIEGARPHERTEVRVLYDAGALYVVAILSESNPSKIARQLVRRDERGQYDHFELSLDPDLDQRTGYRFRVGASGVQRDVYLFEDTREDEAWDAVWESAVTIDSAGWTVEMRIPLSQIRYAESGVPQTWGVNFARRRVAADETSYFALESRIRHGRVSVFGRLEGLLLPTAARRLEVRPYGLARARVPPTEAGNPFADGATADGSMGVDMRYGVTPTHTLDLTINPDFGQVEVDPAVINLSAFETFFPEKRPFFVEDAQIFSFSLAGGRNQLFYSRRVGREPQGDAPDDFDFADIPGQTTILGSAKLTGRSAGGLAIGALGAVSGAARGTGYAATADSLGTFVVQPRTWHGVVRLTQDLRRGATQIGAMATVLRRDLPGDGSFDFLAQGAVGLGVDFDHQWGGPRSRDWALNGFLAGSVVHGSEEALIKIQRASNHYFQRPDATRFAVDSTATSLAGRTWRVQLDRRTTSTSGWSGGIWLGEVTSGIEVNDLGFMTNSERLDGGMRVSFQRVQPSRIFRSWRASAFSFHNFRHEAFDDIGSWSNWKRAYKGGFVNLSGEVEFRNTWSLNSQVRASPQTMSDNQTRGGPLMVDPASLQAELRGASDRRRRVVLEPRMSRTWGRGFRDLRVGIGLAVRPLPTVEIQLEPTWQASTEPAQYVTQTDATPYAPTFGRRYLFSDLERRELSLDTRLNLTFSTRLTFQLFAQPLVSGGDYLTYKQLAAAESFAFDVFEPGTAVAQPDGSVACTGGRICELDGTQYVDFEGDGTVDYSLDDRDFNIRSLRLNAVLRWEFRPGSTVFLVWQQSRRERVNSGRFDLWSDLGELGSIPTDNIFIAKIVYWIGM